MGSISNQEGEPENSIDKKLSNNSCSKNNVPLDEVEDQVDSFNKALEADDPKFINIHDKGQNLSPNLPESVDSKKSKEINQKFISYQKLLKDVNNANANNNSANLQQSFIQIKKYEKIFKKE